MYWYRTSNFFPNPHSRYGHVIECAKIKIISSSGVSCRAESRKLYQAARREVTGDAAQYPDFAACELVTGVCAHARSPAGLLSNTGYLTMRLSQPAAAWGEKLESDQFLRFWLLVPGVMLVALASWKPPYYFFCVISELRRPATKVK
jgi:hypothetical protein